MLRIRTVFVCLAVIVALAPGTVLGVTEAEGVDAGLDPPVLAATTVNV